ncbi:hypothetical protein A1O3_09736 [Capronia epimyces CBS 606.96]|uniref:Rhodopsin domain-containing protein n=1 Tax=Capronia epimyces CBS 606.96 TaxID=1182542 RepID=W9Y4Y0_9EURO|nr:uncharacterized protein A1O3_09736 [Capronia epimyces CBS 606.96]EXJ77509.1 hypothetical protein A1O3_09736 [Capronia epimyces CBS 606.96]
MADSAAADPTTSGDRYFRITDQDHRGSILVVSVICVVYIPMILSLRGTFTGNQIGMDEYLAIAASVIGVLQYVMIFVAISHGFGRSYFDIGSSDAGSIGRLYIASIVLFFVALFLTKCCVILLCRKLFSVNMRRSRLMCDSVVVICGLWCLGAILGVTVGCGSLGQIGYRGSFCHDLTTRWNAVAVIDAVTELLIFSLSVIVVVPLQMRLDRKIAVMLAFAPRLITIILIGLHAHYIDLTRHSSNPGVEIVTPVVYQQVQLLFALVSAALPALNRGLRKFNTSMGSTWMETTASQSSRQATRQKTGRGTRSIPLKSLNKSQDSDSRSKRRSLDEDKVVAGEQPQQQDPNFRPDKVQYNTSTYWGNNAIEPDARSGESQDSQNSEANIIRKDMQWQVRYENNNTPA